MNATKSTTQPTTQPTKTALVLGLGATGYSAAAHLFARGVQVTVADTRVAPPCLDRLRKTCAGVTVIGGRLPLDSFDQYDRVIASPGLALDADCTAPHRDARAHKLIGDIELFAESARAPLIAVTGTNGKSTVTTLVDVMLRAAGMRVLTGGNLGTPALQLLEAPTPDCYVLELSSFQLQYTHSLAPAAAALLNLSADHLDWHGDFAAYAAAKSRVLTRADARVLCRTDPGSASLRAAHVDAITFGVDAPPRARDFGVCMHDNAAWFCRGDAPLAPLSRMALCGQQNRANVLAAMALVDAFGAPLSPPVIDAALNFRGLAHRCELVGEFEQVRWINDSKGTNVGATVAAIDGMHGGIILIAGGDGKGADFAPLRRAVAGKVGLAVLFGADAAHIAAALGDAVDIARVDDLRAAMVCAQQHARAGHTVLFSPACASFDMFDDYQQRGETFKQLLDELIASTSSAVAADSSTNAAVRQ